MKKTRKIFTFLTFSVIVFLVSIAFKFLGASSLLNIQEVSADIPVDNGGGEPCSSDDAGAGGSCTGSGD